jgi:hypothetical protein
MALKVYRESKEKLETRVLILQLQDLRVILVRKVFKASRVFKE